MTIAQLYDQLSNKDFQDYQTGNLFFPAYMYMYDATKEYEINREILDIKNRLHRPTNYLDVMVIDIFEEFVSFLKQADIAKNITFYDFYISNESESPKKVDNDLHRTAYSNDFLDYLNEKINQHLTNAKTYEVAYVFIKGFGNAFPHIRASRFMNKFEKYIKGYKMILFYPGTANSYYSLFGLLRDENLYRAIKLIN